MPKIVAICGSLRVGSVTRKALEIALEGAREYASDVRLIDLREYDLSFCNGSDTELSEDVHRLRREVLDAQGIILGTPEYHGSFSGVLKNALDLMSFDEFTGKMVGLVGVAEGGPGAGYALAAMRTVARHVHAWVIPEQASVPRASSAFGEDGRLKDRRLEERLKTVGRQVARYAWLHHSEAATASLKAREDGRIEAGQTVG